MPISNAASGSQTATLATDHTLATVTAPTGGGAYLLVIDKSNLTGVETVRLRFRSKARAADTVQDAFDTGDLTQDGPDLVLVGPLFAEAGNEVVAILRQEGGTGRAFPWAIRRLDG